MSNPTTIDELINIDNIKLDSLLLEKFKPSDFYIDKKGYLRNKHIDYSNIVFVIYTGYNYVPLYNSDITDEYKRKFTPYFNELYYDSGEFFINPLKWTPKIIEKLGEEIIEKVM